MRTTELTHFVVLQWKRLVYLLIAAAAVFLIARMPHAQPEVDGDLSVLVTGVGSGTVTSDLPGINCPGACARNYARTATVTLTASPTLAKWDGDCAGTPRTDPCILPMTSPRAVRANFGPASPIPQMTAFNRTTGTRVTRIFGPADFLAPDEVIRPEDIQSYLDANPSVDTPAEFLAALLPEFKYNWILMSRSESLQTGIADSPRLLLPSADARFVFTFGMTPHSSYPGSSPVAIEYMQWDAGEKNFRFHEIVLAHINEVTAPLPTGTPLVTIPARDRKVSADDEKCSKCHSTRNIMNVVRPITTSPPTPGPTPGSDGNPAGLVPAKNKPNWDTYDSWGGAMPFNRDRIYQGSLEAAAFRKFFNPWTYETNPAVGAIIEQLELQPPGIPTGPAPVPDDQIFRVSGGPNDGHIRFAFDDGAIVMVEPSPSPASPPDASVTPNYSFDGVSGGAATGSMVIRGGRYVTLHHSRTPSLVEGRAVQFFDLLGGADGNLNQLRIGSELSRHRFATGSIPLDARPVALAITQGCITRDAGADNVTPRLDAGIAFFTSRHGGMTLNQVFDNTRLRAETMPRRKADIEKRNLDRTGDPYLDSAADDQVGLIPKYGANTSQNTNASVERVRQEVFRRPIDLGINDNSEIGGFYVDREHYLVTASPPPPIHPSRFNTEQVALYRYLLEPLGVSVDKWSMGVRGRSRTYSFADIFVPPFNRYISTIQTELETSLNTAGDRHPDLPGAPPFSCTNLMTAVNREFTRLPLPDAVPTYTDVQRIFNKSCIECHGGLGYPPFTRFFDVTYLDLSENENSALGNRLDRPNRYAMDFTTDDPATSTIYRRIIRDNEDCNATGFPRGMMPCGGPKLNYTDIDTIRRWIVGPPHRPYTHGDPHIKTVDGTNYDFQGAGEFVLLRGENLEVQARQTPVETEAPLGPNDHTGLSSCVSLNTAAAVRVGPHRITYQPNLNGRPDPSGLQLRVDGNLVERIGERGIVLPSGGRILPTTAPGGIQIQYPGGSQINITPGFWEYYQLWHLDFDMRNVRATEGVMGSIAPGNWLPALPDGTFLGPRPADLSQRYQDLYEKFADAWRVTATTSLFDYAPGISTSTFTVDSWPGVAQQQCRLQKRPAGEGPIQQPLKPLSLEVARQQCAPLVENDRRTNCENDVMVTGEIGFAKTYLLAEQIQRNAKPETPELVFPEDDKIDLGTTVSFDWKRTIDPEGDDVRYMHCVWPMGQLQTFKQCVDLPKQMGMVGGVAGIGRCWWLVILLIICLLILIILYVKKRRVLFLVLAIVVLIAIVFVFYFCRRSNNLSKTVSSLEPGKSYYWKVIVEDGKGGITVSETRRFAVK